MCGIVGGISTRNWENARDFVNSIAHRGPDDSGIFVSDSLFLGHTRLSIIDLSRNGSQPMESADGRYVIIYNGELYNHFEIRCSLVEKYKFISNSDTETILYAYIEYGSDCLEMFNGIFAFAIYDKIEENLMIARDRFGVKPLYLYADDHNFLFSSEIKSFLNFDLNKSVNYKSIVNYLSFLWSPGPQTPLMNVVKLLPGHYITLNKNNFKEVTEFCFCEMIPDGDYFRNSEAELVDELDQLLTRSLSRQMLSDVPIGFFLSGGLDSTLLVAMARKLYPERQFHCFTIDNGDGDIDGLVNDLAYAKYAAALLSVDLHIVKSNDNFGQEFAKMIWHLDEPQSDPAALSVYKIAVEARKYGIKVLIGGTGADDIFSGYRRHSILILERFLNFLPRFPQTIINYFLKHISTNSLLGRRLLKVFTKLNLSSIDRMKSYFLWLDTKRVKGLFKENILADVSEYDPLCYHDELLSKLPNELKLLDKLLYLEMKTFLVDHNLNYTDKMSMAVGVEARVPYLDNDLVAFAQRVPPTLKLKGVQTKYLLRKVAERYLPDDLIYRKKSGFGVPLREWMTGELNDFVNTELSKDKVEAVGLFDFNEVSKLCEDNRNGKVDASYTILGIMAVQSWYRQFINNERE